MLFINVRYTYIQLLFRNLLTLIFDYYDYYQIYGIGPQRIDTEGIACSKVFFLYPKGNLVKKWDNSTEK